MKINLQDSGFQPTDSTQKTVPRASRVNLNSINYANEKQIQRLEQQNIIDGYFKIFDDSLTEIEIKNLISEKLQPSFLLPQVHNTDELSLKAKELLDFSLSA